MADKNRNINIQKGTITIATSETTTTGTVTANLNGIANHVTFTTPDMQSTNSTKLEVIVTESPVGTVFNSGTKAESSSFSIGSTFPLYGSVNIVATAEGTQAANKAIPYTIYYET